jgi:hypothetical protein
MKSLEALFRYTWIKIHFHQFVTLDSLHFISSLILSQLLAIAGILIQSVGLNLPLISCCFIKWMLLGSFVVYMNKLLSYVTSKQSRAPNSLNFYRLENCFRFSGMCSEAMIFVRFINDLCEAVTALGYNYGYNYDIKIYLAMKLSKECSLLSSDIHWFYTLIKPVLNYSREKKTSHYSANLNFVSHLYTLLTVLCIKNPEIFLDSKLNLHNFVKYCFPT